MGLLRLVALLVMCSPAAGLNSGGVCAGCVIVVRVIDMGLQQGIAIDPVVDKICNGVFGKWPQISTACTAAWKTFGPSIIKQLEAKLPEVDICKGITLCDKDSTCRLVPPKQGENQATWQPSQSIQASGEKLREMIMSDALWTQLPVANHKPAKDLDGDGFSDARTLRGYDWRGKDCDDLRKDVYPGRKTKSAGTSDHNCNGISDWDEAQFCKDSEMRRLIIFGDSASAHFHVPWGFDPSNPNLISQLVYMLENELDYPEWSWGTGYDFGSDNTSFPEGDVDSLYMRLVKRNRCNNNFRENLSVNGARSTSVVPDKTDALSSNATDDLPAIVFYAFVGNDVINPHIPEAENAKQQTTPKEFREKVLLALSTIEKRLPNGSHVVLLGLEHGGNIWPHLQSRVHPGLSNNVTTVTYRNVWDLLNCNGANPAFGWLDANESFRLFTSQRAQNLSNVLKDIARTNNHSFASFDLTYIDNPDDEIAKDHMAAGGDYAELVEWVGGGHPSQKMHALTAKKIWEQLERIRPDILGPVNPHNAEIDLRLSQRVIV